MQIQPTSQDQVYTQQIITQLIKSWSASNKNVTDFFAKYQEQDYLKEIAPGRNRAIYLLGHLIAVNDGMLPLFGLGEKLFPELEAPFLKEADKSTPDTVSLITLQQQWQTLNEKLATQFSAMPAADWLDRHTAVSPEDFAINPLRNKLNVLISRINHQAYHMGQLNLLSV